VENPEIPVGGEKVNKQVRDATVRNQRHHRGESAMTPHQAIRITERAVSGDTEGLKAAQISEAIERLWQMVLTGK